MNPSTIEQEALSIVARLSVAPRGSEIAGDLRSEAVELMALIDGETLDEGDKS